MKKRHKYYYGGLIGALFVITCVVFGQRTCADLMASEEAVSPEAVAESGIWESMHLEPEIGEIKSGEPEIGESEIGDVAESAVMNSEIIENTVSETPEPSDEYDITLMAIGDNLLHMGIVNTGKQADGTRNYDFLFDGIRDILDMADIKIINQETIFGGNQLGFHGYPKFNSPSEVSDAIADAGFNVVLQATNHTADQGLSGMQNCIELWKTHPEILVAGLHEPFANQTQHLIPTLEIDGCTFAFLNYTYGPNSASVSSSIAGYMDMLCAVNDKSRMIDFTAINPQVLADITLADTLADIVVVCPHWGTEYATTPSSYQEQFAMQMTQAGADLIIGTHPHVVQPITWIEADNGNRALCYYSLGNYVSTQKNAKSMLEGLAWVTFHVSEEGVNISEENTGIVPLVCHYSSSPVRLQNVYLLENYTEALAQSHGIIPYGGIAFHLGSLQKWSEELLGNWVLSFDSISQQYCAHPE